MQRLMRISAIGLCLGAGLVCGPARAATVVAVSDAELVAQSDAIFLGSVVSTRSVVRASDRVFTHARVQVYRGLHGVRRGQVLTVEVAGGRRGDGIVASVPGAPSLHPGDVVVGFVARVGEQLRPLGLAYGWFRVTGAPDSQYVYRELEGLRLLTPPEQSGTTAATLDAVPLSEFLAHITQLVRRQHGDGDVPPDAPWHSPAEGANPGVRP